MTLMPDMDGEQLVEREMWATAGDYLCVVTGTGRSIKQAAERAYKVVDDLHIADMIYRDDIGEKIADELPKLQEFGYATEFNYE
jgi:phosphoribosylamine-glycine ligase